MTATATPPQPKAKRIDPMMHGVAEYLKAGPMPLIRILSQVFRHPGPTQDDALALSRVLSEDPRFTICDVDGAYGAKLAEQSAPAALAVAEPVKSLGDLMSPADKAKVADAQLAADAASLLQANPVPADTVRALSPEAVDNVQRLTKTPGAAMVGTETHAEKVAGVAALDEATAPTPPTLTGLDRLWDPALTRDFTADEAEELAAAFYAKTGTSAPFKNPTPGETKTAEQRGEVYVAWFKANQQRVAAMVAKPQETGTPAAPAPVTVEADADKVAMRAEIERLRAALKSSEDNARAYALKQTELGKYAAEVKRCEANLESAKAEVGAAKQMLATANSNLASRVYGDAQQTHPDLKPAAPADDEDDDQEDDDGDAPAPKATKPKKEPKPKAEKNPKAEKVKAAPPVAYAGPAIPWQYGVAPDQITNGDSLPQEQNKAKPSAHSFRAALVEHIPEGTEVAKLKPAVVLWVKGIPHLARSANDTGTRWFLQVLYSQPEWNGSGLADTYGRPVEGMDDNAETKSRREAGGHDNGRMVKIGAKLYVLTPEKLATVVTFTEGDRAAPVAFEGKSMGEVAGMVANAAAVHSEHDEMPEG